MASRTLALSCASALLGTAVALFNMFDWPVIQGSLSGDPAAGARVLDFFVAQGLATALVVVSLFEVYKVIVTSRSRDGYSVLSVMKDALSSVRAVRVGVVVGVLYAILYSFVSSLLVYQPGVDFAKVYGVSQPGWAYTACCGVAGTVPTITVYLSPALHLGMEVVPLTLLFLFLIPILVGLNAVLSFYALKLSSFPVRGRWLAGSGAVIGLFTACPTCAGLFLAGSFGAAGATLAIALAPYQVFFIAVTLPVLIVGPVLTAVSVRRSYEASCRVPPLPATGKMASA